MELCLMSSSTYAQPLAFNQDHGVPRPSKEFLSIVPSTGRKQEMLRTGLVPSRAPLVGDPFKPMGWLFSDQCARLDSTTPKPVLIDVQDSFITYIQPCFHTPADARPDSILFSFGISENCARHEKVLQYLMTGSKDAENDGIDYSLLSSLAGIQTIINGSRLLPYVPHNNGACLYGIGSGDSQSSVLYPSGLYDQKPLLGPVADSAHFSKMTVHPDGRILLTGNDFELKDVMSVFEEFQFSPVKLTKQPMLVPHFTRPDTNESQLNVHGSSLKMETKTFAPIKSPVKIKLKPSPKKSSSRKAVKERDLCRRSSFHAFESLLSLILDKNRGKAEILSLKKCGTEVPQLLTKFSAGIAGTGLAVLFSVACSLSSGRAPFYASSMMNAGFGSALVWLSWSVNKLRDTVVQINKSSSKVSFNEKEIMKKVDTSVNEIFFRAATIMVIGALRFV